MTRDEQARQLIYQKFNCFLRAFPPERDYIWEANHTKQIIKELQLLTDNYKLGKSSHTIISVPPRSGKSDLISRRFPAWFLLNNPRSEILLVSYSLDLARTLSEQARNVFKESAPLYGLSIDNKHQAPHYWKVNGLRGSVTAVGIKGSITGKGADVLIIDDFCKSREEAESKSIRDKTWESFRHNLWTRLAPHHIVVLLNTRWHSDDLIGRIENITNPKSSEYEETFPIFKHLKFPILKDGKWLFQQGDKFLRFSEEYYQNFRATLGEYGFKSIGQQDPASRHGNLFKIDKLQSNTIKIEELPGNLKWVWGWDIAKSLNKDADYTVGCLSAYFDGKIYVKKIIRGKWSSVERDEMIANSIKLMPGYKIFIENTGNDSYQYVSKLLKSNGFNVSPVHPAKDKLSRASIFEPLFEIGNIYIIKDSWNAEFIEELTKFPDSQHDDQVDAFVLANYEAINGPKSQVWL